MDEYRQQSRAERYKMYCYFCDYEMTGARIIIVEDVTIDGFKRTLLAHPLCEHQFYDWVLSTPLPVLALYREERLKRP